MKKVVTIAIAIWASGLMMFPQLGEAEMSALTDSQMGKHFFRGGDLSLSAGPVTENDIETEVDKLAEETEEAKLENYNRERSTLFFEKSSTPELTSVAPRWEVEYVGCSSGSGGKGSCSIQ